MNLSKCRCFPVTIGEGDVNAYKALMDSGYGAPVQQVEQTNIELPFFDLNETEENNGTSKDS